MPLDPDLTEFTTASPVIATFPAADLADGTGIHNFKGYTNGDDSDLNAGYNLGSADVFSNQTLKISGVATSASFEKKIDVDFDVSTFNLNRTINGNATLTMSFACQSHPSTTSDSRRSSAYIIAKIIHVDKDSNETILSTVQSDTLTSHGSANGLTGRTINMKFNVSRTPFQKGETLRLTIEGWLKWFVSGFPGTVRIYHDPKDRDIPSGVVQSPDTTKLDLFIPFEVV